MNVKNKVTCKICGAIMDFVMDNLWLKCRGGCGYMEPVEK